MLKTLILTALGLTALTAPAQSDSILTVVGARGALSVHIQTPQGAPKNGPAAIICHGLTGNQNEPRLKAVADKLLDKSITTVRFDFNGHGHSDGQFSGMTIPNEVSDLDSIISWLDKTLRPSSISLVGHSQGAVVAIFAAAAHKFAPIRSLALLAPATVLQDYALQGNILGAHFNPVNPPDSVPFGPSALGRQYITTAQTMPLTQAASTYTGPVLIIHGTEDRAVPIDYGRRLAQTMPHATFIPVADDHGFKQTITATATQVADFIDKNK